MDRVFVTLNGGEHTIILTAFGVLDLLEMMDEESITTNLSKEDLQQWLNSAKTMLRTGMTLSFNENGIEFSAKPYTL